MSASTGELDDQTWHLLALQCQTITCAKLYTYTDQVSLLQM